MTAAKGSPRKDEELHIDPDVPEADAVEQSQEVGERKRERELHIDPDVPEADALEQAREVPWDEDEDYR